LSIYFTVFKLRRKSTQLCDTNFYRLHIVIDVDDCLDGFDNYFIDDNYNIKSEGILDVILANDASI